MDEPSAVMNDSRCSRRVISTATPRVSGAACSGSSHVLRLTLRARRRLAVQAARQPAGDVGRPGAQRRTGRAFRSLRVHRTDSGPVGAFCGDDVTQDGLIQGMHFDWLQWC